MQRAKLHIVLFFVINIFAPSYGQLGAPNTFSYQAIARDILGSPIVNQIVSIKVDVNAGNSAGVLVWQETHVLLTDLNGLFTCLIGNGTSTGAGTIASFSSIPWQANSYYLKIEVDFSGGTTYISMGAAQLVSVPYSFYSTKTEKAIISTNDLKDMDTSGIAIGKIFRWDGSQWRPSTETTDSVQFSTSSGIANYANTSDTVNDVNNSLISDTVNYAINSLPYNWSVTGNSVGSGKFLGTRDSSDLMFSTSALERLRFTRDAHIGIGTNTPVGQLHLSGNDGLLSIGIYDSGIIADLSNNTRFMWSPKKASLRIGQVSINRWTGDSIGNYSAAIGYNCEASGIYSFAGGFNCRAVGEGCVALGKDCYSNSPGGLLGGSIAIGDSCVVNYPRCIAFGYKAVSLGGTTMGYRTRVAQSAASSSWGAYTNASSGDDIAMGYYASSNNKVACFIFADASSANTTLNSTNSQYMVRASGGVIFYSDPALTNGVELFPGGGAWASVSDSSKKQNFRYENTEVVLKKITGLKIECWNYKSQSRRVRHVGGMAQDFYPAFLLGENSTSICTIDIDGVTMLGIKAIEKRTHDLYYELDKIGELKVQLKSIDNFNSIEERINKIEQTLRNN